MEITTLLAQLWGPVLLATGIGIFVSRAYYVRIYRDLENSPFAVLIFGMMGMAAGIVHVNLHSLWGSLPEILVSVLGWGLLIKGTLCTVAPSWAEKSGDWWGRKGLISYSGFIALAVGGYLSWFAYLA